MTGRALDELRRCGVLVEKSCWNLGAGADAELDAIAVAVTVSTGLLVLDAAAPIDRVVGVPSANSTVIDVP